MGKEDLGRLMEPYVPLVNHPVKAHNEVILLLRLQGWVLYLCYPYHHHSNCCGSLSSSTGSPSTVETLYPWWPLWGTDPCHRVSKCLWGPTYDCFSWGAGAPHVQGSNWNQQCNPYHLYWAHCYCCWLPSSLLGWTWLLTVHCFLRLSLAVMWLARQIIKVTTTTMLGLATCTTQYKHGPLLWVLPDLASHHCGCLYFITKLHNSSLYSQYLIINISTSLIH